MADAQEPRDLRDDELLSAYLDGELPPDDLARLENRLANEPELARRLERLLQADGAVRRAYQSVADEPLPSALLELLADDKAGVDPGVVRLDRVARRRQRRPALWARYTVPRAIAAGIVVAVGVALGVAIGLRDGDLGTEQLTVASLITPDSEFYEVLETMPSGTVAELSNGRRVAPRLSFRAASGGYCREIGVGDENGGSAAVACRGAGGWRLEAIARVTGPLVSSDEGFVPASGGASELDDVIAELIDGAPLGAAEERQAISLRWQ